MAYVLVRIIIFFIMGGIILLQHKNAKKSVYTYATCFLELFFIVYLLYRISSKPDIFLDEGNGMYDSWCLINYGVDSNLMKLPVYLESYAGNGQSVLYAYLAGPFLKVLGYHIYAFRLPIMLLSMGTIFVIEYTLLKNKVPSKSVFFTMLVIITSPWLLIISRWGMDCNIAPFIFTIGTCLLYLGSINDSIIKQYILYIVGVIIICLTAYAYNVSWLFLPISVLGMATVLIKKKKISLKQLILLATIGIIEVLPIVIFAVRSNIESLNYTKKILFWTSPKLQVGRVDASFINLHDNVLKNIIENLVSGVKMFLNGSDALPWNSIAGYGAYYMFALPFFLIGLIVVCKRRTVYDWFILVALLGMIPSFLLVTPNYNHWMFMHIPTLFIIAIGINSLNINKKAVEVGIIVTYIFSCFMFIVTYFNSNSYSWENNSGSVLKSLKAFNFKKVYYISDDPNFVIMVRDFLPISPYEYQKTKDNPYSTKILMSYTNYANFEPLVLGSNLQKKSMLFIEDNKTEQYSGILNKAEYVKTVTIDYRNYNIYYYEK